ncbi:MAG: hypothetical protein HY718_18050 [Planctomycetes bacterium]|nr:hypothetical protein [Planctomycetota bacterium]
MIQCSECEHCVRGPDGQTGFTCNPFSTIKEPECLIKWQLIKLDLMVRAYQATVEMYKRLAPLQEKMFRHMQKEVEEMDEADSWKYEPDDPSQSEGEDEDRPPPR